MPLEDDDRDRTPAVSADLGKPREDVDPVLASVSLHIAALDDLASNPLAEHADRYQQIHTGLQAALAEIGRG